jgi:hypothetical protein
MSKISSPILTNEQSLDSVIQEKKPKQFSKERIVSLDPDIIVDLSLQEMIRDFDDTNL